MAACSSIVAPPTQPVLPTLTTLPLPTTPTAIQPTDIPTLLPPGSSASGSPVPVDCSLVERLAPKSEITQRILAEFIDDYRRANPTEYMAFEEVISVDRMGGYILIMGAVTSEQRDAILVQEKDSEYTLVEWFIHTGPPLVSERILPDFFAEHAPQAPRELIGCADTSRFVDVPPAGEFAFDPRADCSPVESVPVDSEAGMAITGVLNEWYQTISEELVKVEAIQRQGNYYAVTTDFKVNPQPGLKGFFIVEETNGDYTVLYTIGGGPGAQTRLIFIRNLFAEVPDLPTELLNCLDVSLLFARLTPEP
jgi:hypothetical protein